MIIDNFIEKIIGENDSEILKNAEGIIESYCNAWNVSKTDFYNGKELFKTILHFIDDDFYKKFFIDLLSGDDVKLGKKFIEESVRIIRKQEDLYPNFNPISVYEAIINIIVFESSIEHNENELQDKFNKWQQNLIDINEACAACKGSLTGFETGKIDIDDIIDGYYVGESLDIMQEKCIKAQAKLDNKLRKTEKLTTKKGMIGLFAFGTASFIINPIIGGMAAGSLFVTSKNLEKTSEKFKKEVNHYLKILYRWIYWSDILKACYSYYCRTED